MKRLKTTEVKAYREQLLQQNNNICPLCEQPIEPGQDVLDHHHQSGLIRNTIHRFCNTFLGKIENNVKRNKITEQQLVNILQNYVKYVSDTQPVLHPTYKTPEEKKALAKKRAKRRRDGK